ncbi:hypothetical protein OIO90_000604 [Microbotryomycetes sp. JL221]|nr:hypothetical protein OIO90_000604 [Microbotryomycetes sp. JL221]
MVVKSVTSYEEFKQIIEGDRVAAFDFWATWCGPCKMIGPVFEKLSESEQFKNVDFYKVDVDEQEQIAAEVGIKAMPTFTVFKGGDKLGSTVGADPKKLQALIETHVDA